jgi:hypothetical protein
METDRKCRAPRMEHVTRIIYVTGRRPLLQTHFRNNHYSPRGGVWIGHPLGETIITAHHHHDDHAVLLQEEEHPAISIRRCAAVVVLRVVVSLCNRMEYRS